MKIKKGDTVKVLTGTSRGKTGKVLNIYAEKERLTVEGVNLKFKHSRPKRQGQKGQKIEFPASLHISNVALVCTKCGKATRVSIRRGEGEKKRRLCKKCNQMME